MKFNTNVFFFATVMIASFAARAEGEQATIVPVETPAVLVQVPVEIPASVVTAPAVEDVGVLTSGSDANAAKTVVAEGLLDKASAVAVAFGKNLYTAGEYGFDVATGYAKDGIVEAGKGVSHAGVWIQEHPGYVAAGIAAAVSGYVVYQNYFAPCKDCKKAKTTKSNN